MQSSGYECINQFKLYLAHIVWKDNAGIANLSFIARSLTVSFASFAEIYDRPNASATAPCQHLSGLEIFYVFAAAGSKSVFRRVVHFVMMHTRPFVSNGLPKEPRKNK